MKVYYAKNSEIVNLKTRIGRYQAGQRVGPGLLEFLDDEYTLDYPIDTDSLTMYYFPWFHNPKNIMPKKISRIKL